MRIVLLTLLFVAACFADRLTSLPAEQASTVRVKRQPRTIHVPADHGRIQQAIDAANDGDTVLVAPGVYRESLQLKGKQITLASRFLMTADKKDVERTVLDGKATGEEKNSRGNTLIRVAGDVGPKTRIIGFTIKNGDDGISCSAKIEIAHNRFINNGDAIDYEGGGGLCRHNLFEKNRDDAVDLDGATEATIEDNLILNSGDDGIEIRLHKYSGKLLNIVIRRNQIIGSGEDGIQIIDYPDKSDRVIRIERNVIAKTKMAALGCMANGNTGENYEAADIPERIEFFHNTLVDNQYGITGGDSLLAFNNVIVGTEKIAFKEVDGNSLLAFNLLWDNEIDQQGSNLEKGSTILKNPQLTKDYHLSKGSPCVDAGSSLYKRGETVLLEIPRSAWRGRAPDLGAFERIP
ncbi:MAG: right-handed parallel beta-helix repeat-containing protein [Pirellulaceae bacterium]